MVMTCYVCKWRTDRLPTRSFHRFPTNEELKQKWLQILGKSNVNIANHMALCSKHFEENCFQYGLVYGRRHLKKGSVPTLNLNKNNIENNTIISVIKVESTDCVELLIEPFNSLGDESSYQTKHLITDDVPLTNYIAPQLNIEDDEIEISNSELEVPEETSSPNSDKIRNFLDSQLKLKKEEIRNLKKKVLILQRSVKRLRMSKSKLKTQLILLKKGLLIRESKSKLVHKLKKSFHQRICLEQKPFPLSNEIKIRIIGMDHDYLGQAIEEIEPEQKNTDVSDKPLIECNLCGHEVTTECDLQGHLNQFHQKMSPHICHICKKVFFSKFRLSEHMSTHTNNTSCLCYICGGKFASSVNLKMHMRKHTGEAPYPCDICDERFRSSTMMKTHRLKKHLEKTICCPLCDSMFFIVTDMRRHFKRNHWKFKDGRPFNHKDVDELPEELYYLFEDGRLRKHDRDDDS